MCLLMAHSTTRQVMTDFSQTLDKAFIECIETFLAAHPEGISEQDFLRHLEEQGYFQLLDAENGSSLLLFQKHFLLFHVLYALSRQRVADKHGALQISPLLIKPLQYAAANTQIGEHDALADYYLDLDNLASTSEDNVNDLLDAFWARFLKNEKRGEALKVLGLSDPVSDREIVQRYRKLVAVHHPDKGGDTEKIQAINEAYAVLIRP